MPIGKGIAENHFGIFSRICTEERGVTTRDPDSRVIMCVQSLVLISRS